MCTNVPITIAHSDGFRSEIMAAALQLIQEAVAQMGCMLKRGIEIAKTKTPPTHNVAACYMLSQGH
jgi:hypothetical protein